MENAKTIVNELRKRGLSNGGSLGYHSGLMDEAADLIEKLQAERDLAIQDLHTNTKCHICKHLPNSGNMTHCPKYASCGLGYIHFEWRGATKQ